MMRCSATLSAAVLICLLPAGCEEFYFAAEPVSCEGVTCSGHGTCRVVPDVGPMCECEPGYRVKDRVTCVATGDADTDVDTDVDTDADTDADTDSDTDEPLCWDFRSPENDSYNQAWALVRTADGGYLAGGETGRTNQYDFRAGLWKLDLHGRLVWSRRVSERFGRVEALELTPDRGFIGAGWASPSDDEHYSWIFKLDEAGALEWERVFDGGVGNSASDITRTLDGGYVFCGSIEEPELQNAGNLWIVRLDSAGNQVWAREMGRERGDHAASVHQDADGNLMVGGLTQNPDKGNDMDYWLLKLDLDGETIWERVIGGDNHNVIRSMAPTADGGCVAVGHMVPDTPDYDFQGWVVKTDRDGVVEWEREIGEGESEEFEDVRQTRDGGYILTGMARHPGGGNTFYFWLVRLDAGGKVLWNNRYYDEGFGGGTAVLQADDGGFVAAGIGKGAVITTSAMWAFKVGPYGDCKDAGDCRSPSAGRTAGWGMPARAADGCPAGSEHFAYNNSDHGICSVACQPGQDDCGCYHRCSPLPLSDDLVVHVCLPGDLPCARDEDCEPGFGCLPSFDDADSDGQVDTIGGYCGELWAGGAEAGAPCDDLSVCASGLCSDMPPHEDNTRKCTEFCIEDSDCIDGYSCQTIEGMIAGGEQTEVDLCWPIDESCADQGCGDPCQGLEGDCPDGMDCLVQAGRDFGFCTRRCDPDQDDCGALWHCGPIPTAGNGSEFWCMRGQEPCQRDADCGDPQHLTCLPSSLDQDRDGLLDGLIGRCGKRLSGPGPGESCTSDVGCYNNLCTPVLEQPPLHACSAFCLTDTDCPTGMHCRELLVDGSESEAYEGRFTFRMCLGPVGLCDGDADCDSGKICGLDSLEVEPGGAIAAVQCREQVCEPGTAGCAGAGDPCGALHGAECSNGLCIGMFDGARCRQTCASDADCTVAGQSCQLLNNNALTQICVGDPVPCTQDTDCTPQGFEWCNREHGYCRRI